MLEIKNLTKIYTTGDFTQKALDNISVSFRDNEFVSILGQSGSGKTTMLNIVGGLDQYTSGDLLINGVSTIKFKDRDWDSYRNHQIGFVFQSYNLIEHQSILANVELALALSGVSKETRRQKSLDALAKVGLQDHVHKRPNQLSGGQMQRVAIARALVNNPEILLADEPTGALDSETSLSIMSLLKEIAQEKLVIMVTHNQELAEAYSTRVINLKDGQIIGDTDPVIDHEVSQSAHKDSSKTKMSLRTALGLSFNNLLTKKARTTLTAFAGSIGIIGIALILSLSNGVQLYINNVEKDTLSSYPISLEEASFDTSQFASVIEVEEAIEEPEPNTVYSMSVINDFLSLMSQRTTYNNLEAFKTYIEDNQSVFDEQTQGIQYSYPLNLNIYLQADENNNLQVEPNNILDDLTLTAGSGDFGMSMGMVDTSVFSELLDNEAELNNQYDIITGHWPMADNEVVILTDSNQQLSDLFLYTVNLLDRQELYDNQDRIMNNLDVIEAETSSFAVEDLMNLEFKVVLNTDFYEKTNDVWIDQRDSEEFLNAVIDEAQTLRVVGVMKAKGDTLSTAQSSVIGYSNDLTASIVNAVSDKDIVNDQIDNPDINVITGLPFATDEDDAFSIEDLTPEQQMELAAMSPEQLAEVMSVYQQNASMTYESNLNSLGVINLDDPSRIQLYPKNFEAKDELITLIDGYNTLQRDNNLDENVIGYTDLIATLLSSVTTIINIISYILIAFVAVSLIVSSIMIGIITYISVLERTKEIGILRAIGASKKDISRVFNAETLIIGLFSGVLGIAVTLVLLIPINNIVHSLTGVHGIAQLPYEGAIILIVISVILTLVSGLIPSRMAAKKDPVEALRSE